MNVVGPPVGAGAVDGDVAPFDFSHHAQLQVIFPMRFIVVVCDRRGGDIKPGAVDDDRSEARNRANGK